jgi:hypothetical protein
VQTDEERVVEQVGARDLVERFSTAFHGAAGSEDFSRLEALAAPGAVAAFLVESHSATVVPLVSRTAVPAGARLELDLDGLTTPLPGLVLVPFTGHGFARPDFTGELRLELDDHGRLARVRYDAP